ncbi:MAG: NnrS family protein [Rubrivivax sp.]|nr:NnrS family protein [Rubrivivax sp.]
MSGPGDSPAASDNPPWRAARLLQAPHRLAFFAGAVLMAFSALWWAAALLARQMAVAWAWAVPPAAAHGLVMALAFMPMFMLGFLFTAGPRWLGQPEQPARRLLAPVAMMCAGWSVALPGFHWHAGWAAAGLAGVTLGWLLALARFTHLVRTSRVPDRAHARRIVVAAGLGGVAMTAATFGLVLDGPGLVRAAAHGALWAFVAPVFAIVAHRMIPFFTASVLPTVTAWRPSWLLDVMLATLWFTALVEVAQALWWPLPAAVHGLAAAVQAPAAVLLLWLALRWGLVQSLRIRLLAMLHGGFLWLGVAIALAAASHLRAALLGEGAALGLAPLHALTMGYLGATLFAMVTRVVAGHSGRPLVADNIAWALYWGLQLAVLLRLVAALGPQLPAGVLAAAALAWAAACAGWAARYGRWLGRPRADGRPG